MRFAGNKILAVLALVLVGVRPFEILAARGINASAFTEYMNWQHLAGISFSEYRTGAARSSRAKREMFLKCSGSSSIASQFARGTEPAEIAAGWEADLARFKGERSQYLLY